MNEEERRYHEVSGIFPLMQGAEFEELKADIKENGLLEPIWLHPDGSIIDGRNRHRACIETGIAPTFRTWKQNGGSLVSFVVSLNLKRRHLNSGQRAVASLEALKLLEAEAKERMRWTPTNTSVEIIPPSDNGKAREKAAEIFQTNPRYVSDAKKLQEVEPAMFEQVKTGEITLPQAMRKVRREEKLETIAQGNKPLNGNGKRYSVIYADPPWQYDFSFSDSRDIENHYPTMPLEEIMSLPVENIVSDQAILFLWCPPAFAKKGIAVMEAWGFEYRTNMTWDKESIGAGQWVRQQHEHLFIGRRGDFPTPETNNRASSIYREKRREHSQKPDAFYGIIERMYPQLQRIELFARNQREGWDVWGNQV